MNKSLTDESGEVREMTTQNFKSMKHISDFPELQGLVKQGRPKKANPKKSTTIRLDPEILDFFKARGKGWQTEINNVLQDYVDSQSA